MTSGACCIEGCREALATSRDVFCVPHWKQLPRRYRVELVMLRNAAQRRSKSGATDYARAIAAAAWLLTVGQAAGQATSAHE